MPRGRPKVQGDLKQWDIRITPTDQQSIEFTDLSDFQLLIVCQEGEPNGTPQLHYHMIAHTYRSDTWLDSWCSRMGKATADKRGNAVFSKRKQHDGSIGYVVKCGNVVCRHGTTQTYIDEQISISAEYRKRKEAERKSASRGKQNFLQLIMKEVAEVAVVDPSITPTKIMALILGKYSDNKSNFPSRSVLENAVMTIYYKVRPNEVIEWYSKNFSFH